MRKLFVSIVLSIITLSLSAQHMTFMGVSMGKDIQSFTSQLSNKGLWVVADGSHDDDYWVTMDGDFWDFEGVSVLIKAPFVDGGVSIVTVWNARGNRTTTKKLVASLDNKYGNHTMEHDVIARGDTKYKWHTQKGDVELLHTKYYDNGDGKCNIEISYIDYPQVRRKQQSQTERTRARANDL